MINELLMNVMKDSLYKSIIDVLSIAQYEYLSNKDIRAVYQDILLALNRIFSVDVGFIAALKHKNSPEILSLASLSKQQEPYWVDLPLASDLKWTKASLGRLAQEKEPVVGVMSSFLEKAYFKRFLPEGHFAVLPLLYGPKVYGFLAFLRDGKGFDSDEIEALSSTLFFLGNMMHTREVEKEKVRLFEEVKAQKVLLEKFIHSMPVSVAVLDQDLSYLYTSRPWVKAFNSKAHSTLKETFQAKGSAPLFESISTIQKSHGYLKQDIETNFQGTKQYFTVSVTTWFSSTGAPGGVIVFCEDITAEKILKNRLEETIEQLKESNQQLDHFATICAHDLREPLRSVSSYSQLLGFEKIAEAEKEIIREKITKVCKSMADMVQSVLSYSKFNHMLLSLQDLKLKELIEDLKKELESILKEKNAVVQVQGSSCLFRADRPQMNQLFLNLIVNSLKYNQSSSPRVCITQQEKSDHWIFQVEDNGVGFDKDDQEYAQSILEGNYLFEGLKGLGLRIVWRVVNNHGGSVSLAKSSHKGSVFIIKLPKHPETRS